MKLSDVPKAWIRGLGRNPTQYAFRATTDGAGDMTLVAGCDVDGAFAAPTRATATYTITIGAFKQLRSCIPLRNTTAQTLTSITPNPSAGTIVLVYSAAVVSTAFEFLISVDA